MLILQRQHIHVVVYYGLMRAIVKLTSSTQFPLCIFIFILVPLNGEVIDAERPKLCTLNFCRDIRSLRVSSRLVFTNPEGQNSSLALTTGSFTERSSRCSVFPSSLSSSESILKSSSRSLKTWPSSSSSSSSSLSVSTPE